MSAFFTRSLYRRFLPSKTAHKFLARNYLDLVSGIICTAVKKTGVWWELHWQLLMGVFLGLARGLDECGIDIYCTI